MNIRKISLLSLIVVGISFIIVSVTPISVFAGAPPTGKDQSPIYPTKKPKKTKTPTKAPTVPTSTFTATKIPTSTKTSTATKIPTATKTATATKVPSSTPTIVPYIPPKYPSPCCGSGAIILAGYAFFAVRNSRSKKTEI
jgi:hypothetical protein